jgi:DNA-binding transcriptional LysR family regulator
MNKLRFLNFDDLYLLQLLLEGATVTATAQRLGLTQPAVTQRLRKIEGIFECKLMQRTGRRVRLTDEGRALCNRAVGAIALMGEVATGPNSQVINVGTRPEVGMSWLWPSVTGLRQKLPHLCYHLHFGSGEEILRLLGIGTLDVVLTSAPLMVKGFGAVEVAREDYVFVAHPDLAKKIRVVDDLKEQILIEHDRSFPFLRYVAADQRASLRYRDVWFLGSSNSMTAALLGGFGVGIIPHYLVQKAIEKKQLKTILPNIKIDFDHFRLIYRTDRAVQDPVEKLAAALIARGLR